MKEKKKLIFILIIILPCILIAIIGSIRSPKDTPTEPTETNSENDSTFSEIPDTMTTETILASTLSGIITDIHIENSYLMIGETMEADYYSQTQVSVNENTLILMKDAPISLSELSIGYYISVKYTGGIVESAPAQLLNPSQIVVTTFDETGVITEINPENSCLMIGNTAYTDYKSQTMLSINENTDIMVDGILSSINELMTGDYITIQYSGEILGSGPTRLDFPLQITKMETYTITGVITEINSEHKYFMFAETIDADYKDAIRVSITDNTVILINDMPSFLSGLCVGDYISIEYDGAILETDPGQLNNPLIIQLIE